MADAQRKIASIALMAIMVAGGLTFAVPGAVPDAHAAPKSLANLAVSTDRFGGPMVLEITVNDPQIDDVDTPAAEPDVEFDGHNLKMVQGSDGSWYAYVAHAQNIAAFDDPDNRMDGIGMDFGTLCADTSVMFTDNATFPSPVQVYAAGESCGAVADPEADDTPKANNVIRNPQPPSGSVTNNEAGSAGVSLGNTRLAAPSYWPFIQAFDDLGTSEDTTIKIIYKKAGSPQEITITYDTEMDDYASLTYDREEYPQDSHVHLTFNTEVYNVDPTDEDTWTFNVAGSQAYYQLFEEDGEVADKIATTNTVAAVNAAEYNGVMSPDTNSYGDVAGLDIRFMRANGPEALAIADNAIQDNAAVMAIESSHADLAIAGNFVTITETTPNSGVFTNTENHESNLRTLPAAPRDASFEIDYDDTTSNRLVKFYTAILSMDLAGVGSDWNSGEKLAITLTDQDLNRNSLVAETLTTEGAYPSIRVGSEEPRRADTRGPPATVANVDQLGTVSEMVPWINYGFPTSADGAGRVLATGVHTATEASAAVGSTPPDGRITIDEGDDNSSPGDNQVLSFLNAGLRPDRQLWMEYDFTGIATTGFTISIGQFVDGGTPEYRPFSETYTAHSGTVRLDPPDSTTVANFDPTLADLRFEMTNTNAVAANDMFTLKLFLTEDPLLGIEMVETGPNTGVFAGTLEYLMVNQIEDGSDIDELFEQDVTIRLTEDQTGTDSIRIEYPDTDAQGQATQVTAKADAPTHTGSITLDQPTYKHADTVTITVEDADLNTDSETIEIYSVIDHDTDRLRDTIALAGSMSTDDDPDASLLLEAEFGNARWIRCADNTGGFGNSITGLVETGRNTGIFTADFQIPANYCDPTNTVVADAPTTLGQNLEITYYDFLNAAGSPTTTGASAGISAATGSVSLDRTVYPVPFGSYANADAAYDNTPESVFPLHDTLGNADRGATDTHDLGGIEGATDETGDLTVYVQINDQDYNTAASGVDNIAEFINGQGAVVMADPPADPLNADIPRDTSGPVTISVSRGSDSLVIATAGERWVPTGTPASDDLASDGGIRTNANINRLGPIQETEPGSGIFELEFTISHEDGPASEACPRTGSGHVLGTPADTNYCILQGDILTIEYVDIADASGNVRTVTDSATFDLRNGALQADKSVYIIGSNMILTLIEPDLDLDSGTTEEYTLDLIEWDSDAHTVTMGPLGDSYEEFDPVPAGLQETGDGSGIFQAVLEVPRELGDEPLDRGEQIDLEYTDWGPSGADYVGSQSEDIQLTIFTSNFGATIQLDQQVYTWTDKVFITITAPDHNFDSDLVDEIGDADASGNVEDPLRIATQDFDLPNYSLAETGPDTGIFSGEVILTGFNYDADGDTETGNDDGHDVTTRAVGLHDLNGPTDGTLPATDDDGISVSYEFSEDETVVASALIRWNIGEVQWLEASYPASGTGIVRVIDPDMNWNPEAVDNFGITVVSDSVASGIRLTVTETNEATGIFEGTVFFSTTDAPEGSRLRVAEGDTITAKYSDHTLPELSSSRDDLTITATALIGTIVPPLERVPVSNLRLVDALGTTIDTVQADQQVSIQADLTNGQDKDQQFAYLVQVQDSDGVTVALSWIDGNLAPAQTFSPSQSWIPAAPGTYTATVFVWESVSNPTALSPPVETTITVS